MYAHEPTAALIITVLPPFGGLVTHPTGMLVHVLLAVTRLVQATFGNGGAAGDGLERGATRQGARIWA
jgi:hypothetical protein